MGDHHNRWARLEFEHAILVLRANRDQKKRDSREKRREYKRNNDLPST